MLQRTVAATCISLMLFGVCDGTGNATSAEDEALHVRRIAHLWQDQEYDVVETEIVRFLDRYPSSEFADRFSLILGDLAVYNQDYEQALVHYESVPELAYSSDAQLNYLETLISLQRFEEAGNLQERLARLQDQDLGQNWLDGLQFWTAELYRHQERQTEAEKLFRSLESSVYAPRALLSLADIYLADGRQELAVAAYRRTAEIWSDERETFLFKAADLESNYAKSQALEAFTALRKLEGERSSDAAWRELQLLAEMDMHRSLVDGKNDLAEALDPERLPVLEYQLGRSYVALGDYEQGLMQCEKFILTGEGYPEYHRAALLNGLLGASHQQDIERVGNWLSMFEKLYPSAPERSQALRLAAMAYRSAGDHKEALLLFQRIASDFPTSSGLDRIQLDIALQHFHLEKFEASRSLLLAFLEGYPTSEYVEQALQLLLNNSVEQLRAASNPEEKRELLAPLQDDIDRITKNSSTLTDEQQARYLLSLARAHYELKAYQEVLDLLSEADELFEGHAMQWQAHFLMAYAYYETGKEIPLFITHAQQAIQLNKQFPGRERLQKNLLKAYLKLAKEFPSGPKFYLQREEYLQKATELIFEVAVAHPGLVERSKILWAAKRFAGDAGYSDEWVVIEASRELVEGAAAIKAIELYKLVLPESAELFSEVFSEDDVLIERDLYRLACLYGRVGRLDEQVALLKLLRDFQAKHPTWPWTRSDRVLFALSHAYDLQGQPSEALASYEELLSSGRARGSVVGAAAQLHWARLALSQLSPDERRPDTSRVSQIVSILNRLRSHRLLSQEPLHLEAAIDHAVVRASLAPQIERDERLLEYLGDIKQEFTHTEDLWAKDYHAARKQEPEKDRVYQAYMMLIDGYISQLKAAIDSDVDSQSRREAALAMFGRLRSGEQSVTGYLKRHAEVGLRALEEETSPLTYLEKWDQTVQ